MESGVAAASRILVLDDDPFMLKLLVRMLAQLGYWHVDSFEDGRQALARLAVAGDAYGLVLMDIHMPRMDGVEFLRGLTQCRFRGGIVLVSGETSRILDGVAKLVDAHELKLLGQLRKPVTPGDLARVLAQLPPGPAARAGAGGDGRSYAAWDLRDALARGELVNHYQPKVALDTGEVVGVECLVRWQHPVDGLVGPARFIGLATASGLVTELTRVVLASAMAQARDWQLSGHELSVAVNVTMDDLEELDFPDRAALMAESAGIDPASVTLEVTESQVMRKPSAVLEVITRLELKRFRLSIDDFGTGHSSLAQLRDLPFDELKVDRSFVHGSAGDETRRAICSASVRMAHELKLRVVAEGIEDPSDWNQMLALGCDLGQGYFIARPMPAADIPGWIATWDATRRVQLRLPC